MYCIVRFAYDLINENYIEGVITESTYNELKSLIPDEEIALNTLELLGDGYKTLEEANYKLDKMKRQWKLEMEF